MPVLDPTQASHIYAHYHLAAPTTPSDEVLHSQVPMAMYTQPMMAAPGASQLSGMAAPAVLMAPSGATQVQTVPYGAAAAPTSPVTMFSANATATPGAFTPYQQPQQPAGGMYNRSWQEQPPQQQQLQQPHAQLQPSMLQSATGMAAQPPQWLQPVQQPQQMWSCSQQTPAQVQTQPQYPSSYAVAASQGPQDRSILPPEAQQHLAAMRGPYGMQTAPQQPQQYTSYGVPSSSAYSMPSMQPAGVAPQQPQLQAPPAYQQQFQPQQQYQAPPVQQPTTAQTVQDFQPLQQQGAQVSQAGAAVLQQVTTPGSFLQSRLLPQQQQSNVVYSVDPFSLLQVLCSSYLPMHVQAGNSYQVFDETGRRRIKATIMLHGLIGPDNGPRSLPCTAIGDSVQDSQAAAAAYALSCLFLTCGLPLSEGLMQLYFERYGQQWQPDAAAVQEGLRLPMPVAPPLTNTQTPKPMISQLAVKYKVSQKYEGPVPGSGMFGSCYLSTCLLTVAKGGGTQPITLSFVGEGNTIKASEHASAAAALQWLWKHGLSVHSMGFDFLKQTFDYQQRMRYMPPDEPDFLFGSEVLGMAYPVGQAASAVLQLLLLNGGGAAMGTALPMPIAPQQRAGVLGSGPLGMAAQAQQQQQEQQLQQGLASSPWQVGVSAPEQPMAQPPASSQAPPAAPPYAAEPYPAPPAPAQAPVLASFGSLAPQPQSSVRQALAAWAQQTLTSAPAPPAAMAQQHTAVAAQAMAPSPAPTDATAATAGSAAAAGASAALAEGITQPRHQALQQQQQQEQELVTAYEQLMQRKAAEAEQQRQQEEQQQRQQQVLAEQARLEAQQVQLRQQELEQQQAEEEAQVRAEEQQLQSQEQQRPELQHEWQEQGEQQRQKEEEVAKQQQKEHGTAYGAQQHEDDWLLVSANSLPSPMKGPLLEAALLPPSAAQTPPNHQAPQPAPQPAPAEVQYSAAAEAAAADQQVAPADQQTAPGEAAAAGSSTSTLPMQGSSALQAIAQVPDLAQLLQQPAPVTVLRQQGAGSRGLSPGPDGARSNEEWRNRSFQTWGRVPGTGAVLDNPLVWIDLEMTGLDPQQDKILEIAAIITDGELSTVIEGPCIAINYEPTALSGINAWSKGMHDRTGLLQRVADSSMGVREAEAAVLGWIRSIVPARCANLAGSSVYVDRAFIMRHMPALHAHLHHRVVDVSTLLELARRWYPDEFRNQPRPNLTHGALQDITDSIEQLRYWRTALFKTAPAANMPEQEQAAAAADFPAAGCASDIGCAAVAINEGEASQVPFSASGLDAVAAAPAGEVDSSGAADVNAQQQVAICAMPLAEHGSAVASQVEAAVGPTGQLPGVLWSSQPVALAAAAGLQAADAAAEALATAAADLAADQVAAAPAAADALLVSDAARGALAAAPEVIASEPGLQDFPSLAGDMEADEAPPGMCESSASADMPVASLDSTEAEHAAADPAQAAAAELTAPVSAAAEAASARGALQPAAWPQETMTPQLGAPQTGSQAKAPMPPPPATAPAATAEDAAATAVEVVGAWRQVADMIDLGEVAAGEATAQQEQQVEQDKLESQQKPGETQLMSSSVEVYDVHGQPGFLPGKEKGEETGQQRQIQQDQEQQEDMALPITSASQGQHELEPMQQQELIELEQQEQAHTPVADSAETTISPAKPARSIDSTHSTHGSSGALLAELDMATAALTEEVRVLQQAQEERDAEGRVDEDLPPGLFSTGSCELWPAGGEGQALQQGSAEEEAAAGAELASAADGETEAE